MSAVIGYDAAIDVASARSAARYDAHAATGALALHPAVLRIAAAAYALMIATFWVGFVTTGPLAVAMVIVTVCLVAYIGVPWSMALNARRFNVRRGIADEQAGSSSAISRPRPAASRASRPSSSSSPCRSASWVRPSPSP
jgi:hypothetical protein